MITIEQLLESVDLDFEPRFVTKNLDGTVYIWKEEPMWQDDYWFTSSRVGRRYAGLKLAEFTNKYWVDCIYEVPRKTTGKIEKIHIPDMDEVAESAMYSKELAKRLNQVIDAINELKGAKNE